MNAELQQQLETLSREQLEAAAIVILHCPEDQAHSQARDLVRALAGSGVRNGVPLVVLSEGQALETMTEADLALRGLARISQ